MEKNRNGEASPSLGVCYRLYNFLINNFSLYKFKQISQGGRSSSRIPASQEENMGQQDSEVLVYLCKDDDLAQHVTEAVERLGSMDKTTGHEPVESKKHDSSKMKKAKSTGNASMEKSVTFKFNEEENAGQISMAMKDGAGKALKDYNDATTKKPRLKPRKPVMPSASNIDEKSESFIQKGKKSFAS